MMAPGIGEPDSAWDAALFDRSARREEPRAWSAGSARGVVAAAHYLAAKAGGEALAAGGNAFDAAVAAGAALGVCEPAGSGLGGMAQAVAYAAASRRLFTVEAPCLAPRAATPEAAAAGHRLPGCGGAAVPTAPRFYAHLLERYGRLARAAVLAPAIRLAEEGYPLTAVQRRLAAAYRRPLSRHRAGALFLAAGGKPPPEGARLRQPALARTLRRLAGAGFEDFYSGELARAIDRDMRDNGGFVRARDLEAVPAPRERAPLTTEFRGGMIASLPPPGGGMALLELLGLSAAEGAGVGALDSPQELARAAALIRRVRRDRRRLKLGVPEDPERGGPVLLSARYATETVRELFESGGETTHVAAFDRWGNAVSLTQSIERSFGCKELCPELGFLYNGYLRAFKVRQRRHPHYLRRGAPARSNAAPALVLRGGAPVAALGSTGSERLASGMFQVLLRLRAGSPFAAVHAPRLHCTPEGLVQLELERFPPGTESALRAAGFALRVLEPYSFHAGGLQLAVAESGAFTGVADPRRDGFAAVG